MATTEQRGAAAETITITVDGKAVSAKPKELVIAAAERAGVYIPRFCYHPRMRPVGMCRMCLVEQETPRGPMLVVSCMVEASEGAVFRTDTPMVKKAQDGVLEFLLINHPLDCPVCDKGGECPLQDQTLTFGPGETRFVEEKRHYEKPIALSDLVYMDRERCILCDRCTRFSKEVAGDPLIHFINRGAETEVNTFPDHPFASYFSGNTVQICPVGALLSKPYRFKARPWDVEQVESTCTTCAVGCRMAVQSSQDKITRYLGLDSDPVNHGWLCDRGRYNYEWVNSDERLQAPRVRDGDALRETSWPEALEAAAQGIQRALDHGGPSSVGVIGGARLPNEDQYAWAKLAATVLRTDNTDAQLGDGLPAEVVLGLPRATIDEAAHADVLITLAPDVKETLPVLFLRLREAAVDRGLRIVELTPVATGLTKHAAATLLYRPGEAAAVAAALVGSGDPTEVGGVPAEAIARARQAMEGGGNVVVLLGRPTISESGASVAAAAGALAQALPDARFLSALPRGNVHGALDMGLAPGMLPGRVSLDDGRQWFGDAWGGVPEQAGLDTEGMLRAAADGGLQALVLVGADPLADFPDRVLAAKALASVPFVLAVDTFVTESVADADVVLPAAAFGERPGTTTNQEGRITRLGQKITPVGLAWPDWMIASELAFRLGGDLGFSSIEDIWDEVERLAPSHAGITRAALASRPYRDGVVAPLTVDTGTAGGESPVAASDVAMMDAGETGPVQDPTVNPGALSPEVQGEPATTVDPSSTDADGEAQVGEPVAPTDARPPLVRFAGVPAPEAPRPDAYSHRLVATRRLWDAATTTQRSPSLRHLAQAPAARVHPADLDRLGVRSGGQVRLKSARQTLTLDAVADAGVPRGSVALVANLPGQPLELIDLDSTVTDVRLETP